MAPRDYDSPSSSPSATPRRRRLKTCARRCERACCTIATYFPLAFVYGLTSWAVWVQWSTGFRSPKSNSHPAWWMSTLSIVGSIFYVILNACYTVAVFKDPGSPMQDSTSKQRGKYSVLPTTEPRNEVGGYKTVTVSSSGGARYCKKCHTPKPDRAHHCSTCRRCVLKMDHHCPWLATCLGLHNYKAFVLFLIYVCLFCWVCFVSSAYWLWKEVFEGNQYLEELAPVNVILLSILSGILGLVLTGFTAWHLYLCIRGQTTIEALEKTRYLKGVRLRVEQNRIDQHQDRRDSTGLAGTLQRAGDQMLEIHANVVPGATRFEEGEEHMSPPPGVQEAPRPHYAPDEENGRSPAEQALRRTYSALERTRERERYEEYLDDEETQKMPHAFDLGWRRNLLHLFGPNPFLWFLPVCNTTGDGWRWEVSEEWIEASAASTKQKSNRAIRERSTNNDGSNQYGGHIRGGQLDNDIDDYNHPYGRSQFTMQNLTHPQHSDQTQQHDSSDEDESWQR